MGKSPSCLEYLGNTCINVCIYCTEITAQVSRVVASIQYVTVLSTVFEQKQTCRLHRNRGSLAQSTFFLTKVLTWVAQKTCYICFYWPERGKLPFMAEYWSLYDDLMVYIWASTDVQCRGSYAGATSYSANFTEFYCGRARSVFFLYIFTYILSHSSFLSNTRPLFAVITYFMHTESSSSVISQLSGLPDYTTPVDRTRATIASGCTLLGRHLESFLVSLLNATKPHQL